MGKFRPELFEKLRNPTPQNGFDECAMEQVEAFKQQLFELVMLRARDFMCLESQGQIVERKQRIAVSTIELHFTDGTFHPGEPIIDPIYARQFDDDAEDTVEVVKNIRSLKLPCD